MAVVAGRALSIDGSTNPHPARHPPAPVPPAAPHPTILVVVTPGGVEAVVVEEEAGAGCHPRDHLLVARPGRTTVSPCPSPPFRTEEGWEDHLRPIITKTIRLLESRSHLREVEDLDLVLGVAP